jgi:hypothetical protein
MKPKKKKGWTRDQKIAITGILIGTLLGLVQIALSILPYFK